MTKNFDIYSSVKNIFSRTWAFRYLFLKYKFYKETKNKLRRQLTYNDESISSITLKAGKKIFIPLIESSHYQFYQILGLAKALQMRGATVKVLLCGSSLNGCELKSVRSHKVDPCLTCRFNKNNTIPLFDLDTIVLSDLISAEQASEARSKAIAIAKEYPNSYLFEGIDIIPMVNDSVVRYYYGAIPDESSEEIATVRASHIETAILNFVAGKRIYSEWKPDIVMGNMNVYSIWEPYFKILSNFKNIEYKIISMSTFNYNSVVVNRLDIYKNSKRFNQWLKNRRSLFLNDSEKEELNRFLKKRFAGGSQIFIDNKLFEPQSNLIEKLNIDTSKRNIFLFTNIYWDVGLSETGSLYKSVIDWVLNTIELVRGLPNCHVFIKTHPAEVFDSTPSLKGVIQFILDKYVEIPKNITIIRPEFKIKAYELFPFIDLGIVYNGTLGLEMLTKNIPVVVTGLAPYGYLDSVQCPQSISEYKEILTGKVAALLPNPDEVELFSYFYFIKTLLPWTLTEKAYSGEFKEFTFNTLDEIVPGKDKYLDHLCNCILNADDTIIENW